MIKETKQFDDREALIKHMEEDAALIANEIGFSPLQHPAKRGKELPRAGGATSESPTGAPSGKVGRRKVNTPTGFQIEIDEANYLGPPEDLMELQELVARAEERMQQDARESEADVASAPSSASSPTQSKPEMERSSAVSDSAGLKTEQNDTPNAGPNGQKTKVRFGCLRRNRAHTIRSEDQKQKEDQASQKEASPPDPVARLKHLVALAKGGNEKALKLIQRELDSNPSIWQAVGDLSAHAETLLINVISNGNPLVSESLEREIERLKNELMEGSTPSTLERLTIQRITACWLFCQYTDRSTLAADAAGAKAASWGRRQEWAERRYQHAIKSLDLVRRMKPRKTIAPKAEGASVADALQSKIEKSGKPKTGSRKTVKPVTRKKKVNQDSVQAGLNSVNRIKRFAQETVPVQ